MNTHEPIVLLRAAKEELGQLPRCSLAEMLVNARADQLKYEDRSESLAERLDALEREIAAAKAVLAVAVPFTGTTDLIELCEIARSIIRRNSR